MTDLEVMRRLSPPLRMLIELLEEITAEHQGDRPENVSPRRLRVVK